MYRVSYDSHNRTFFYGTAVPVWARPDHCRGFTITPRHTHTHTPPHTHTHTHTPHTPKHHTHTHTHPNTTHTHTHTVGLLWASDRTVAVYLTTHNTHNRQDSNPQPQQPSGCRTMPVRPQGQWDWQLFGR